MNYVNYIAEKLTIQSPILQCEPTIRHGHFGDYKAWSPGTIRHGHWGL